MSAEEVRSPDLIRNYFDLLSQRQSGDEVELLPVELFSNWQLQAIQQATDFAKTSIARKKASIFSVESNLDSLGRSISSNRRNLSFIEQEMASIQQQLLNDQSGSVSEFDNSSANEQFKRDAPGLPLNQAFKQLLQKGIFDFRATYSNIKKFCVGETRKIPTTLIALSFILGLYSLSNLMINLVLIGIFSAYVTHNLVRIYESYKHSWQQQVAKLELEYQLEKQQNSESRRKKRHQELEADLYKYRTKKTELEVVYESFKKQQMKLMNQVQESSSELQRLESVYQQRANDYKHKIEELRSQKQKEEEMRLLRVKDKMQEWLEHDVNRQIDKAMDKLKLKPHRPEYIMEIGYLKLKPIVFLVGVTQRTSPSLIVQDETGLSSEENEALKLYIDPKDFRSETSCDDSNRVYGVYELIVIFLGRNFLAYYRCYLNFIQNKSIDEEYSEYLYDSIVCTKLQEKSSLGAKSEAQKYTRNKSLIIATNDGKILRFKAGRNLSQRTHQLRLSQIDDAANDIRQVLRQRRIDRTLTEDLGDS